MSCFDLIKCGISSLQECYSLLKITFLGEVSTAINSMIIWISKLLFEKTPLFSKSYVHSLSGNDFGQYYPEDRKMGISVFAKWKLHTILYILKIVSTNIVIECAQDLHICVLFHPYNIFASRFIISFWWIQNNAQRGDLPKVTQLVKCQSCDKTESGNSDSSFISLMKFMR